jgi:hypothetical protein
MSLISSIISGVFFPPVSFLHQLHEFYQTAHYVPEVRDALSQLFAGVGPEAQLYEDLLHAQSLMPQVLRKAAVVVHQAY